MKAKPCYLMLDTQVIRNNRSDEQESPWLSFQDKGSTLAASDTSGHKTPPAGSAFHFLQAGQHKTRSTCPDGMAESDRTAIDIQSVPRDHADGCSRLKMFFRKFCG